MLLKKILKKVYLSTYKSGVFNIIPSELFLKIQYRAATGKKLNLKNPKSYNEKIQWIKLYDHNPLYVIFADKIAVRDYVKKTVGEQYLIPLIGIWKHVDDININELPQSFVLKTNHDSGGVYICKDKKQFDFNKAKKEIAKRMQNNYFYVSREWGYKQVKPYILAETYLIDKTQKDLRDYKIFCFGGEPRFIQVDYDRFTFHKRNIYDVNWNYINLQIKCPTDKNILIEKPDCLNEMLSIAQKLSSGLPQLRVDLYVVDNKIYFGELTVYHGGGIEQFTPDHYELDWGKLIDLELAFRCKEG